MFSTGLIPAGWDAMCSKTSVIYKCITPEHKGLWESLDPLTGTISLKLLWNIILNNNWEGFAKGHPFHQVPSDANMQWGHQREGRVSSNVSRCFGGQGQAGHWLCSWSAPVSLRDAEMVAWYFCGKCLRTVLVWSYTRLFARIAVNYKFLPTPSSLSLTIPGNSISNTAYGSDEKQRCF